MQTESRPQAYQLYILALCLFALIALAVSSIIPLDDSTKQLLDYVDVGVCVLFFGDFVYSLIRAPNKWKYFYTWGWIDLVSSIPMIPAFRIGRAARILRVFRVLRGIRATRMLASFALERRAQNTLAAAVILFLLMLVFASIAILQFEVSSGNIKTAEDALWWAVTTVTTVGYGDRFPVTSEGRIVGAMLMTTGVGLFGIVSGSIAAWFLTPQNKQQENETDDLRLEIRALRQLVEERLKPPQA